MFRLASMLRVAACGFGLNLLATPLAPGQPASTRPATRPAAAELLEETLLPEADATPELTEALGFVRVFNFKDALDVFETLVEEPELEGDPAYLARVRFGLAISLESDRPTVWERVSRSRQLYEDLGDDASAPADVRAESLFRLGRSYDIRWTAEQAIELDTARRYYGRTIDEHPGSFAADRAALCLGSTYLQAIDDPDAARRGIEVLRGYLAERPDNSMASAMWLAIGGAHFLTLGENGDAIEAWVRADEAGLLNPTDRPRVYWQLAVVADREDRVEVAARYYAKIITELARSGRAFESRKALERLAREHPDRDLPLPDLPEL